MARRRSVRGGGAGYMKELNTIYHPRFMRISSEKVGV